MIETTKIDGEDAVVSYLKKDFTPATKKAAELIKIHFKDRVVFAVPQK